MNRPVDHSRCSLAEAVIYQIARTVDDGTLVFHGFGSPLVQLALHLARANHAPHMILVAGATYGVNPQPPFLSPTSNDWVMDRGAVCHLDIEELFDLAASGRLARMFLSGMQIDCWGNINLSKLGSARGMVKLPGGGGGANLCCDAGNLTLWTARHGCEPDRNGRRRYRLVAGCDFISSVGHRSREGRDRRQMGYSGGGPDRLVTELGLFDFDSEGRARLAGMYPGVSEDDVRVNTEFDYPVRPDLETLELPGAEMVEFIRAMDPLKIRERELRPSDRARWLYRE